MKALAFPVGQRALLPAAVAMTGTVLLVRLGEAVDRSYGGLLLTALCVLAFAAVALTSWRRGVYLFIFWLVFEDLPRKYLGNNMLVYFGKDVLAGIVYLAFLMSRGGTRTPGWILRALLPLVAFAGLSLVQVFNPHSPSVVYGLVGLKLNFYYVPLLLMGYALVRSEADLRALLVFNLCLSVVVALLGIAQSVVGLDFLNPSQLPTELNLARIVRQAPVSGAVVPRPTSIFVSDARFAWYMLFAFLLGLGALGYSSVKRDRAVVPTMLTVGLVTTGIVLSGSRGTFVYALSSLVISGVLLLGSTPQGRRVGATLYRGLVAGCVAGIAVLLLYPDALWARWSFYYETVTPWSAESELAYRLWEYPIGNLLAVLGSSHWMLGQGTGTASLGGQYVTGLLGLPAPEAGVESGYGAIILELGVLGLVLWLAWTAVIVREAWRATWAIRNSALFSLALAIFWFVALLLFPMTFGGIQPYQNFVFNAYLWLMLGVLFRLPDLANGITPPVLQR